MFGFSKNKTSTIDKSKTVRASELPRENAVASLADSNLAELERIRDEANNENRASDKKQGFFDRIISFFKFNSRFKSGDMTTGQNKKRSDNYYEDFLLAKVSYSQGGKSAYEQDSTASLSFSASENAAETASADISSAAIARTRSDEGDNIEAQTDITYKNALTLIGAKANFKHRILGESTAEYSSSDARLKFMGAFRPLTLSKEFVIQHNYSKNTDKFGEIVGMSFEDGAKSINAESFFIRDGDSSPEMNFGSGSLSIGFNGNTAVLSDISSSGRSVTAKAVKLTTAGDIAGLGNEFDMSGAITLSDEGITTGGFSVPLGEIKKYGNFSAKNAELVLEQDAASAAGIKASVNFSDWKYGFNTPHFELQKEGAEAKAEFDENGRLHVPSPNNAVFWLKIMSFSIPLVPSSDATDFILSEQSTAMEFKSNSFEMFGKTFTNVDITAEKGDISSLSFSADSIGGIDEPVNITQLKGTIGSEGINISANLEIVSAEEVTNLKALVGKIDNLVIDKEGLSFGEISMGAAGITLGEANQLTIEEAAFYASKQKGKKISFKAAVNKAGFSYNSEGETAFSISAEDLSGTISLTSEENADANAAPAAEGTAASSYKIALATTGAINASYGDIVSLSISDLSYANKALTSSAVSVNSAKEGGVNLLNNLLHIDTFSCDAKSVRITGTGISLDQGGALNISAEGVTLFKKSIGNISIEANDTGYTAYVEEMPNSPTITLLDKVSVTFGGGIGLSYSKTEQPKIKPLFDKLKASFKFFDNNVDLEGFARNDAGNLAIQNISGNISMPPLIQDKAEIMGENLAIDTASGKPSFSKLGAVFNKTFSLGEAGNEWFTITNPSVALLDNFTGFNVGGDLSLKIGNAFNISGKKVNLNFLSADNFIPKPQAMSNVEAVIPKFAKAHIDTVTPKEGGGMTLTGIDVGGDFEKDSEEQDENVFMQLAKSAKNIHILLSEAEWADGKLNYDPANLTYKMEALKFTPFKGAEINVDFENKSIALTYNFKAPSKEWPSERHPPELFSLGISYPIFPVLSVGGGFTAGAGIDASAAAQVQIAQNEQQNKVFVLSGNVDLTKAAAYFGLNTYLSFGAANLLDLKLGIEGILSGEASGSSAGFSIGVQRKQPGAGGFPLEISNEKTSFNFDFESQIKAALNVFVKSKLLALIKKDMFTFNIKEWNLFTAQIKGSVTRDENGWNTEISKNLVSDFIKGIFDETISQELQKQASKLSDIAVILQDTDSAVLGIGEMGQNEAIDLSAKYSSEIFPRLKELKNMNQEAYEVLKKADNTAVESLVKANEYINKHKKRIEQSQMARTINAEDMAALNELTGFLKAGSSRDFTAPEAAANSGTAGKTGSEQAAAQGGISAASLQKLGRMPPVQVLSELSKTFRIRFSVLGISENKFNSLMENYMGIRKALKEVYDMGIAPEGYAARHIAAPKDIVTAERELLNERIRAFAKTSGKDNKSAMEAAIKISAKKWDAVKSATNKLNSVNNEINAVLDKLGNADMVKLAEYNAILTKSPNAPEAQKDELGLPLSDEYRLKKLRRENNITDDQIKNYQKYMELLRNKDIYSAEVAEKRREVADVNSVFTFDTDSIKKDRAVIDALREVSVRDSLGITDENSHGLQDETERDRTSYKYDMRPFKKLFPDYIAKTTGDIVNNDEFKRISEAAIEKNAQENISVYKNALNGAAMRTERVGEVSQTLRTYIFSKHSKEMMEKEKKERAGKDEALNSARAAQASVTPVSAVPAGTPKATPDSAKSETAVSTTSPTETAGQQNELLSFEEYSAGRIKYYQGIIDNVNNSIKTLQENILNSNIHFAKAVEIFDRLNNIGTDSFKTELSGGEIRPTAEYKNSLNTLEEADSNAKVNFSEEKINSLVSNTINAEKQAEIFALAAVNMQQEE